MPIAVEIVAAAVAREHDAAELRLASFRESVEIALPLLNWAKRLATPAPKVPAKTLK